MEETLDFITFSSSWWRWERAGQYHAMPKKKWASDRLLWNFLVGPWWPHSTTYHSKLFLKMSEKSLHRTLGISSSRNVSYYCEYSNLKALHSLWVALPPHTNGSAAPQGRASVSTSWVLGRFPRNWDCVSQRVPPSSLCPGSATLHLWFQRVMKLRKMGEAKGEIFSTWRAIPGSFLRPWAWISRSWYQRVSWSPTNPNVALASKDPLASAGNIRDSGSTPGWGRFPWRRKLHPTQYSCLENPMDCP